MFHEVTFLSTIRSSEVKMFIFHFFAKFFKKFSLYLKMPAFFEICLLSRGIAGVYRYVTGWL